MEGSGDNEGVVYEVRFVGNEVILQRVLSPEEIAQLHDENKKLWQELYDLSRVHHDDNHGFHVDLNCCLCVHEAGKDSMLKLSLEDFQRFERQRNK